VCGVLCVFGDLNLGLLRGRPCLCTCLTGRVWYCAMSAKRLYGNCLPRGASVVHARGPSHDDSVSRLSHSHATPEKRARVQPVEPWTEHRWAELCDKVVLGADGLHPKVVVFPPDAFATLQAWLRSPPNHSPVMIIAGAVGCGRRTLLRAAARSLGRAVAVVHPNDFLPASSRVATETISDLVYRFAIDTGQPADVLLFTDGDAYLGGGDEACFTGAWAAACRTVLQHMTRRSDQDRGGTPCVHVAVSCTSAWSVKALSADGGGGGKCLNKLSLLRLEPWHVALVKGVVKCMLLEANVAADAAERVASAACADVALTGSVSRCVWRAYRYVAYPKLSEEGPVSGPLSLSWVGKSGGPDLDVPGAKKLLVMSLGMDAPSLRQIVAGVPALTQDAAMDMSLLMLKKGTPPDVAWAALEARSAWDASGWCHVHWARQQALGDSAYWCHQYRTQGCADVIGRVTGSAWAGPPAAWESPVDGGAVLWVPKRTAARSHRRLLVEARDLRVQNSYVLPAVSRRTNPCSEEDRILLEALAAVLWTEKLGTALPDSVEPQDVQGHVARMLRACVAWVRRSPTLPTDSEVREVLGIGFHDFGQANGTWPPLQQLINAVRSLESF
jgi:hypothetical protein